MNVYSALIEFSGGVSFKINAAKAVGAALANQDLIVLLGRDLLQSFTLYYNGMIGQITISY